MTHQPRRISEFLPEVLQTDLLKKFFAATADHLFEPSSVEYLNGYMGDRPPYYNPLRDSYIREISSARTNYQVSATAVSRNSDTLAVTHMMFYDDLINKLRFQGALVNDHNRLFEAEYYSWGLPVDWDKLINFQNYVWLPQGPPLITLLDFTNSELIQSAATYVYQGRYTLAGQSQPILGTETPLVFVSGLQIRLSADENALIQNSVFVVESVGTKIRLVDQGTQTQISWDNPQQWDSTVWDGASLSNVPNYVLMGRGSSNQNSWSMGNRWFERSVLAVSGVSMADISASVAQRPILEFDYSIPLWNSGTTSRGQINLVDTGTTNINTVLGASSYVIDSVSLDDNMIVLFTNLRNPLNPDELDVNTNNRLYRVTNLRNQGSIVLELLPRGDDALGLPVHGDCVHVIQGNAQLRENNINSAWWYNQTQWVKGQSRQLMPDMDEFSTEYLTVLNQFPLFDLFDTTGTSLADPAVYPGSSFAGSTLVNYKVDAQGSADPVLGFAPQTDNLSSRNYVFECTVASDSTDYDQNNTRVAIPGYKFWQENHPHTGEPQYLNNWFRSEYASRQYVVNQFVSTADQTDFVIDQQPDLSAGGIPSISVEVGTRSLTLGTDYTVSNATVRLAAAVPADQFVKIRSWAGTNNQATAGYFEIPTNLQANPNNQQLTEFNFADIQAHAQSCITNQTTQWINSARNRSLGILILQHRAPMLKLMALNAVDQNDVLDSSSSVVDPYAAILWAQNEYLRFYNKVINSLFNLNTSQGLTGSEPSIEWLSRALRSVNVGKTRDSAWANSGFDLSDGAYCRTESVNPTWVPPTATRLGVTPASVPRVFYDTSFADSPLSLRCHNGAVLVLKDFDNQNLGAIKDGASTTTRPEDLTNPVAAAWLLFEQLIYNSMPAELRDPEHALAVDPRTVFSGKYRITSYSRQDLLRLQAPSWQKWLTFNQLDALRNTTFDINDPFSWNYGGCTDRDHQPVPGHWRGIYYWFYDTDRPHQAPWQMLGFSEQPSWWTSEYGAAPYTSGNLHLWEDLRDGRIAQGARAGVYAQWARPGLLSAIPVNSVGQLLAPFEAGVVSSVPSAAQASQDWKFGDRGPLENVWLTTADSDFLWAQWCYLARPAQFVEYLWDGVRHQQIFDSSEYSQWISTDTLARKHSNEYYVHRENPQDVRTLNPGTATYYGSCGIQHWISEKLVSDSRNVTVYLGNLIRGLDVNLAHRMGGFTHDANSRVLVDSFGLSNNDSVLLPQEDVSNHLMRSASTGEYFFSGVIVEYRGSNQGWRVIGYDSVNPVFEIIPSDTRGAKNTVVIDNQSVIEYSRGLNKTELVAYGTVLRTRQQVYDFLISLGRAQTAAGWKFDQFDTTSGRIRDWSLSAREFLFWSQGPWGVGTYITLSPLATLAKFSTDFGIIQNVGNIVNGAYSVLDRNGVNIRISNLDFLRIDDEISVRPLNDQGIYGLRLYTTTVEHALVFNNRTIFNDTVYNPVINIRQSRFKFLGFRSLNWTGTLSAPGYMVTQTPSVVGNVLTVRNQIIPNFEKSVDDIRRIFDIDLNTSYATAQNPAATNVSTITQSVNTAAARMAQHVIGYQPRSYLTELLVDNSVALQFYQGMIKQKGTSNTIDALLRNQTVVAPDQQFAYFEEFAFRDGVYGYVNDLNSMDIELRSTQVSSNPQLVELMGTRTSDNPRDDVIVIYGNDSRIVNKTDTVSKFKLRTHYGASNQDLPTAGYVITDEADYTVVDASALLGLYNTTVDQFVETGVDNIVAPGDRVWQMISASRGWDIFAVKQLNTSILFTLPSDLDPLNTTVYTDSAPELTVGDVVIVFGVINAGVNIDSTFVVQSVSEDSFDITITSTGTGSGGSIWVYRSLRFNNTAQRDQGMPEGWQFRDISYVDGSASEPWRVYQQSGIGWFVLREENLKYDPAYVGSSSIYDLPSGNTLVNLALWDPAKNRLPGVIDREIAFKTRYDPAKYTNDPSGTVGTTADDAWGNDQVGSVWWDLSTTRFVDYEIGGDSYRRQNWGKLAPGTTVDIYEWVRSTVPPASWQNLVAAGTDLSAIGSTNLPSGQVSSNDQPYVLRNQINTLAQPVPVYYFWVRNSETVPRLSTRHTSTSVIRALITNPENSSQAWWSPISDSTVLLGNVGSYLNGSQSVWQGNWQNALDLENAHIQYSLVRPGDPRSSIPSMIWDKMRTSLVETDALGLSVPQLRLPAAQRLGLGVRPNQTMFDDANAARRAFVENVNALLAASTTPPVTDPSRSQWQALFNSGEPVPAQRNIKPAVAAASTSNLAAYYVNGESGLGAQLIAQTSGVLVLDGVSVVNGQRVLIKDQTSSAQNGVYVVVQPGSVNTTFVLQRSVDFDSVDDNLNQAQVFVTHGSSQANQYWHQTNSAVMDMGFDPIVWVQSQSTPTWTVQVADQAALEELSYAVTYGTPVLVTNTTGSVGWSIWTWTQSLSQATASWVLTRTQSYATATCWQFVDWYAAGYSSSTRINYTWATLAQRDAHQGYQFYDVVKVLNTGSGQWALYVYTGSTDSQQTWTLIGAQNSGIQLLPNLWDYDTYGMGFGGSGFAQDYRGFEYDSRQELDQIIQALWLDASGTQGLLVIDNEINEPNQLFFNMLHRVLSEQKFVDWVFKTSFVNLRGFAERLLPTAYFTTNKTNSLLEYIEEVKPYHVKVRQFVDWRRADDALNVSSTDFDKPPYVDPVRGVRILDVQNSVDQSVLSTNQAYAGWYNNYVANPQLVRKIRTTLLFDRVACAQLVWYAPGYDQNTAITRTVNNLVEWLGVLLADTVPTGDILQVQAPAAYVFVRNQSYSSAVLDRWQAQPWGRDFVGSVDVIVRTMDDLLAELSKSVPPNHTVWAKIDDLQTWNLYVRNTVEVGDLIKFDIVGYQHNQGAVDRITDYYLPTQNMPPARSAALISGCATKRSGLDGSEFSTEDAWDKNNWDAIQGWSFSAGSWDPLDQTTQGGQAPRYYIQAGDGTRTHYSLPSAPQDPNNLHVWVNGVIQRTPNDWVIINTAGSALISSGGLGYSVNDVITVVGGQAGAAVTLKVVGINNVGAITNAQLITGGSYSMVPELNPAPVTGGSGVAATVSLLWTGHIVEFVSAPSVPISNRPNVWIVENGSTFSPAMTSILDTVWDGGELNSPHWEADHPEELNKIQASSSLLMDIYTSPSSGWGAMLTKTYQADSITDRFDIGQTVTADTQLFVFVNGVLQTWGYTADYVIDYEHSQLVMLSAPSSGTLSVISVGVGGASKSVGNWSIRNPGRDYNLFDFVDMNGGVIATGDNTQPRIQITAVSAVDVTVVDGGENYVVGDLLLLRYGQGSLTLSITVTSVTTVGNRRGVIATVSITQAGLYTNLSYGSNQWYTNGVGVNALIVPSWGVADIFVQQRGLFLSEPVTLTQDAVIPNGPYPASGSGLIVEMSPGHIRELVKFDGNGVDRVIQLTASAQFNTVLLTVNGTPSTAYEFDSNNPSMLVLNSAPAVGDTVYVTVFNSSLYSLNHTENFEIVAPTLSYELQNPPQSLPMGALNTLVFNNNLKLTAPQFYTTLGDGSTASFDLGVTPSNLSDLTVWLNTTNTVAGYSLMGSNIVFDTAPELGTVVSVQVTDTALQTYDYTISGNNIVFASWAVSNGDSVSVITFAEDSPTSWHLDEFEGDTAGIYTLRDVPAQFGSMMVFVNGVFVNNTWDYTVRSQSQQTQVVFGAQAGHTGTDRITVYYAVNQPARPALAMRMFHNMYADTQWMRLSNQAVTQLSVDLAVDADEIVVRDGTVLPDASAVRPGVIWIGAERIEYAHKVVFATTELPNQQKLTHIRRGTVGTASGVDSTYAMVSHSGDAQTRSYITDVVDPIVTVDGVFQILGVDYSVQTNPANLVPGIYVVFGADRIPPVGANNIQIIQRLRSLSSTVSHIAGSWVRDGSANQQIPSGYRWPQGNQGLQYGIEPQTAFLVAQPGYRLA